MNVQSRCSQTLIKPGSTSGLGIVVSLLFCLLPNSGLFAQEAEIEEIDFFGLGWLEQTQAFSTTKADALASQLDRFFGVERSDLEAAYSSLRLITEARWNENEGIEPRLRLRGRLYLPRIDERISLIFSEDRGEGTSYYTQNPIFNEPQSTRVNVEVKLKESAKDRFDFRIGLRSSLKLRTSMRYRYESALSESLANRISETVYFIDGIGFGSFTQYQLDKSLTQDSLVRWSTEYRHEENLDGNEWATSLSLLSRYTEDTGISYFTRMAGNTDHNYVDQYQVGLRLRRNFARPWLFWEFSPGYQWEKLSNTSDRDGSLFAIFRLEMAIGRQ